MWSVSQNTLLSKFNTFSILTKHLSRNHGRDFCSLRCDSKTSMNFFSFFTISELEDSFLPQILATSAHDFFFPLLIKARTFTSHLKEALYGTLRLLFGISELPASRLLHFGAIFKSNQSYLNTALPQRYLSATSTVDLVSKMAAERLTGGRERDRARFHRATRNSGTI